LRRVFCNETITGDYGDTVPSVNNNTRTFLAVLAGVAVLYFGSDGNGGRGPTSAVVILAVAAAAIVWYVTRPQKSGADK
jgi:hypothetical protein